MNRRFLLLMRHLLSINSIILGSIRKPAIPTSSRFARHGIPTSTGMTRYIIRAGAIAIGMLLSWSVNALEIAGVTVPETAQLGEQTLLLNGAGSRLMAGMFHVYVIALYLPEKKQKAADIISTNVNKRVTLNFMFNVSSAQLLEATHKLITENHSQEELPKLTACWKEFSALFANIKDISKGDVLAVDYLAASGTKVSLAGKELGRVNDPLFMAAFLKVWLGDKPAQTNLKDLLLGKNANEK